MPHQLLLAGERDLYRAIQSILRPLGQMQVDRQALLRQAFRFSQTVREQRGIPLLLILDELQEIRTLENFAGAGNALALFRAALQSQGGILYLLAGSAVTVLTQILSAPAAPLFAQFAKLPLGPFSREETAQLVAKFLPEATDPQIAYTVHHLTGGYPFYIQAICRRTAARVGGLGIPLSPETVKESFVVETLSASGRIYDFCRYIYDLSLQQATGYGSIKAVLQILAAELVAQCRLSDPRALYDVVGRAHTYDIEPSMGSGPNSSTTTGWGGCWTTSTLPDSHLGRMGGYDCPLWGRGPGESWKATS
ncbi:MAG: hypothetical protein HYS70_00660 [Nitrospinae bacterium]|nr:hypothetical protein [Nitrospinota bacterium]